MSTQPSPEYRNLSPNLVFRSVKQSPLPSPNPAYLCDSLNLGPWRSPRPTPRTLSETFLNCFKLASGEQLQRMRFLSLCPFSAGALSADCMLWAQPAPWSDSALTVLLLPCRGMCTLPSWTGVASWRWEVIEARGPDPQTRLQIPPR